MVVNSSKVLRKSSDKRIYTRKKHRRQAAPKPVKRAFTPLKLVVN